MAFKTFSIRGFRPPAHVCLSSRWTRPHLFLCFRKAFGWTTYI